KNIEQILPFISKSYEMDLNRKRDLQMSKERSEDRKLQREMIKTQKDIALGESAKKDYETLTTKFREEAKKGTLGKILDNYNLTEVVSNNMNDFLKDPTGYADYATMLQGLKALQGDQSVVRGEEIRLGMNRGTLLQKAENALDSLFKGEFLQPEQRTAIRATVKAMKENTKKQYIKNSIPLKNQMKRANIKQEDVFQPDFIDLDNNKEKPDEQIEPSSKPISSEVERKTSDGKIAIFDANTKQFLRYK
ncbi:MAG: hypothetical protein RLY43_134, partial [Bacteroidota bacterium]